MKNILLLALPFLLAAPLAAQGSEADDFEGGDNDAQWTFGVFPADTIETTGGISGNWLRNNQIDMFTVILRTETTTGPWVGDMRATGVSRIHFDAQTLGATFGAGGRQMSVLLRDTKGTSIPDDDDYAYSIGPLVPQVGAGWSHYNFEIPSQSTDAVPAGWKGGWAGDLENFRPGVDWNDVITSIDVVEIWWMDPALFAIFQQWDAGVDNLTIEWNQDAVLSVVPGTAGTTNTVTMSNAVPGGTVRFAGSLTAGTTPFGCNGFSTALAMSAPRELGAVVADGRGNASIPLSVPSSFAGTTVYLQALDLAECRLTAPLSLTFN
ncbi:MAG: hypothetical protein ACYTF3_04460 [Planctomycetota bacterium]|jgi:hypothetical protein